MAIFNSYVSLPEGKYVDKTTLHKRHTHTHAHAGQQPIHILPGKASIEKGRGGGETEQLLVWVGRKHGKTSSQTIYILEHGKV